MELFASNRPLHTEQTPCLILGVFEQKKLSASAQEIDKHIDHAISKLLERGDLSGSIGHSLMLYHPHGLIQAERILLIGCGKEENLNSFSFQKIIKHMTDVLSQRNIQDACSTLHLLDLKNQGKEGDKTDRKSDKNKDQKNNNLKFKVALSIRAISHESYKFQEFKSKPDTHHKTLNKLVFSCPDQKNLDLLAQINQGIQEGQTIAEASIQARYWGTLPSNICTPSYLANQAEKIINHLKNNFKNTADKLSIKIYGEPELTQMGMNCLLAVGKGSREETKLIVLSYQGSPNPTDKPHAIVGKGVTFDSGGLCIKPRQNMCDMKMDMCGAAAVISTFEAAVKLNLPINLIAVVPAAENMPDGNAFQPGNIIKSHQGLFVEIVDTDAEGRLILCDAMSHVISEYKPQSILTTATLTGAIIISLGHHLSGLFTNDQDLADKVFEAGKKSHDGVWQLPMNDQYQDQINSQVADIANLGKDGAGSITAASFLSRFVGETPWVHIDIAGTAMAPQGATGRPVALLVQYLMDLV